MPSNVTIQAHIGKALQFERDLAAGLPSLEWQVVVAYYATLHWMTATVILFLERKQLLVPRFEDHQTLKSQMQPGKANVDRGCQNVYKLLETKSRDARYEVNPVKAITDQDVVFVNGWAKYIRDWAVKHLEAAGYTCA